MSIKESSSTSTATATPSGSTSSGRTSPSTREAIAGMLSIGQSNGSQSDLNNPLSNKRKKSPLRRDHFEENIDKVHQDDEYIYPSLDNSDEDDYQVFKRRGRSKADEAWNPSARVGPLLPKMNRPAREGTKKRAVEKVLEAAAAKRAAEPLVQETHQKRVYKKKKNKTPSKKSSSSPSPTTSSAQPQSTSTGSKPRKGMKTAKQRLGKILKIHKMMH